MTARDTVEDSVRAESTKVLMKTTEFRTGTLEAKAVETLHLVLKNGDLYIHTFTIYEHVVDATVGASGREDAELCHFQSGYLHKCEIPGHESMTGTLTVI